ncbi:Lrp/AsnC family transcriptional regulator [Actinocrinis sp.]|uniref:Lrp/AsnC family transcriptional regulator n=1 Tax=Actinocrinis sp. TaxID=1920516 RepID=UPI002C26763F|nr:Lrp/AsnC family transcriptional regulator [Actinocrinis sp.]HXR73608.1 Lrp/AsnC family transcriptional regulator [Actinocrinis sp.]
MDAVDRTLIEALRANGRATYAELARLVGLSGPTVTDRINRLEQAGVITGYRAMIDPSAVGLGVTALIGVLLSDAADLDDVGRRLRDVPEIEDCWFVAGEESYLVKVRAGDPLGLEKIIGKLNRIRGVARTRTTVALSTKWEGRQLPLEDDPQT